MTERFESREPLGQGGVGQVVSAWDPRLERTVAIKTLLPDLVDDTEAKRRLDLEAQVTGHLEHPNIPPVYEVGETAEGQTYLALRLIQGDTLAQVIARLREGESKTHDDYSFTRRLQIILKVCEACQFAHSHGYLHRDIKPENIMLGAFGEVLLMDWGLAGRADASAQPKDMRITAEHNFVGTMYYAAPEQITGEGTAASDQYAIGATMYELFALSEPNPGKSNQEVLTKLLTVDPPEAETFSRPVQGRVPREISRLIARTMRKEPERRFADVAQLRSEIQAILEGELRPVCPHTYAKRSMHRFGRFLDNHNAWFMPLFMLWLLYPLKDIVLFFWSLISHRAL